jgi:hypothetical protein
MKKIVGALLWWATLTGLSMAGEMPFDTLHYEAMRNNGMPFAVPFHADRCPTCGAQAFLWNQLAQSPEFMGVTLFVFKFDTEKVLERSLGIPEQRTFVVVGDDNDARRSTEDAQYDSLREILRRAIP